MNSKEARRNQFDKGYAQGITYTASPIPGSPENTGKGQNNMTGNPLNRADNFSQPSLDGKVSGIYPDRQGLDANTASQLGAVVNDIPRSRAQQGYDSVSTRGLNQLPMSQTPPTPDAKITANMAANNYNADPVLASTKNQPVVEIMSAMGQVGLPAQSVNPLGFTSNSSQSLVPGTTKTTIPKKSRGIA